MDAPFLYEIGSNMRRMSAGVETGNDIDRELASESRSMANWNSLVAKKSTTCHVGFVCVGLLKCQNGWNDLSVYVHRHTYIVQSQIAHVGGKAFFEP